MQKFTATEIIKMVGLGRRSTYDSLMRMRGHHQCFRSEQVCRKDTNKPVQVYWWEDKKPDVVTDRLPVDSLDRFFELERKLSKMFAKVKELSTDADKIKVLYSECQRLKTFKKYSRSRGIVKMYVEMVQEIDTLMSKL